VQGTERACGLNQCLAEILRHTLFAYFGLQVILQL